MRSQKGLHRLVSECVSFKNGNTSMEELQAGIWRATQQVTNVDQKDFRKYLQSVEADLEAMRCTVDEDQVFSAAEMIVDSLLARLTREA